MVINVVDNGRYALLYSQLLFWIYHLSSCNVLLLNKHVLPYTVNLQLSKDIAEKNQTGISQKIKILCDKLSSRFMHDFKW